MRVGLQIQYQKLSTAFETERELTEQKEFDNGLEIMTTDIRRREMQQVRGHQSAQHMSEINWTGKTMHSKYVPRQRHRTAHYREILRGTEIT